MKPSLQAQGFFLILKEDETVGVGTVTESDLLRASGIFQDAICRMTTFQITWNQQNFAVLRTFPFFV